MPDQRKEIAEELNRLVTDGRAIWLAGELLGRPEGEREELKGRVEELAALAGTRAAKPKRQKGLESEESGTDDGLTATQVIEQGDYTPHYQRWYSTALRVVEQLLPDRYEEFSEHYRPEKRPSKVGYSTYTISDYIQGTIYPGIGLDTESARSVAMTRIKNQIDILASAEDRLDSILSDIEGSLEATLLDDELVMASELLRTRHVRSAGVIAGVVLERHLKTVINNHEVSLGRKKPQLGNLNDGLKDARVFDNPRWREIQRLADIRNLCAHHGERDPEPEEVGELIDRTDRIVKSVF